MNNKELQAHAKRRLIEILPIGGVLYCVPIRNNRSLTRRYRVFAIEYVQTTPDKFMPVLTDVAGYIANLTGIRWNDGILSGRSMTAQDIAEAVSSRLGVEDVGNTKIRSEIM